MSTRVERRLWEPTAPVSHRGPDATGKVPDWLNSFSVVTLREACRKADLHGVRMSPKNCVFARLAKLQFPQCEVSVADRLWLKFEPNTDRAYWVTWGLPDPVRKFILWFAQGYFPELVQPEPPRKGIVLPPQTTPGGLVGLRGPEEGQPARLFA